MDTLTIVILVLLALISLIALWWYFPYFRKPWMPKLRHLAEPREENLPLSLKNPSLIVYKSQRQMRLYDSEREVKRYRIALGINPVDDKRKEGDGCTPEGDFYVCTKNDRSKFHLFLGVSYPNEEDAERGLRSGLVSQEEYDQIADALSQQKRPPWNTRLGGEIGIHGEGTDVDWTHGCVAMSNADIEELFMIMDLGSPVKIVP